MGEVCVEGLGLDCNPLVLVRNNPAQSGTNNMTGTHTQLIVWLTLSGGTGFGGRYFILTKCLRQKLADLLQE